MSLGFQDFDLIVVIMWWGGGSNINSNINSDKISAIVRIVTVIISMVS